MLIYWYQFILLFVHWWHCARLKCFKLKISTGFGCHGSGCKLNNPTKNFIYAKSLRFWGYKNTLVSTWTFYVWLSSPQTCIDDFEYVIGSCSQISLLISNSSILDQLSVPGSCLPALYLIIWSKCVWWTTTWHNGCSYCDIIRVGGFQSWKSN